MLDATFHYIHLVLIAFVRHFLQDRRKILVPLTLLQSKLIVKHFFKVLPGPVRKSLLL